MDKETKVENLMGVSIDKIKQMVDVSTVVGEPSLCPTVSS